MCTFFEIQLQRKHLNVMKFILMLLNPLRNLVLD